MLRGYGVDGRLFLAFKSLYPCSEVCFLVGGVISQPFTVGVGLRQGRVLSPLLFIVYINWIASQRRVNDGITATNCRINHLLFAEELVLLASSEQGLQHAHDRFVLRLTTRE